MAATLGSAIDLRVLMSMADSPMDACLDAIEPAVAALLLVLGEDGRFRFGHDIVRDVLLADLSTAAGGPTAPARRGGHRDAVRRRS